MKLIKKITSLSLLLIFVLPLGYQSIHMVLHHGDEHSDHHHTCIHSSYRTSQKDTAEFDQSKQYETCLICSFEFTNFQLQSLPVHSFERNLFKEVDEKRLFDQYYFYTEGVISLRAPPLHLS